MKTAEEVAEEIEFNHMQGVDSLDCDRLVKVFTQALTAFAEERVNEVMDNSKALINSSVDSLCDMSSELSAKRARAEALEEAAKVADQYGNIGDAIRALKDKP